MEKAVTREQPKNRQQGKNKELKTSIREKREWKYKRENGITACIVNRVTRQFISRTIRRRE
jgi:hypothetical protein